MKLLHLTDLHLVGCHAGKVRGVVTVRSFSACLDAALERHPGIEALVLTGDLVQDDSEGYGLLRATLDRCGLPAVCLPGNHDVQPLFADALTHYAKTAGEVQLNGDWALMPLDSTVPGEEHGRLGTQRLAALAELLERPGRPHLLLALHHPPVTLGSAWIDALGLEDGTALLELAQRSGRVRGILWGHAHQAFDRIETGIALMGTPSTCFQFAPGVDEFAIDQRGPGYRIITLQADGRLETSVEWL
ncbi:MAG: metallophosphoesterase [Steroidobacteraceae bacterium]